MGDARRRELYEWATATNLAMNNPKHIPRLLQPPFQAVEVTGMLKASPYRGD